MKEERLTATQLAEYSGMPRGSIGLFIACGALQPELPAGVGRGRPQVFSFADLLVALAVVQLRLSAATAGLRNLNKALRDLYVRPDRWTNEKDVYLLLLPSGQLAVEVVARAKTAEEERQPSGVDLDRLLNISKADVAHLIPAHRLAERAFLLLKEPEIMARRIEPDEHGRMPRKAPVPKVRVVVEVARADEPRPSKKRSSRENQEKR
jgi:hypothetical protein